jgi:hypothetical protein
MRLVMINAAGYGAIVAGVGPGDAASQTHVPEASAEPCWTAPDESSGGGDRGSNR